LSVVWAPTIVSPAETPGALREARRTDQASLLRRGLQMVQRPRPEDQAEAARLFRAVLDMDPAQMAAHVGLSRIAAYLYALGLDETPERLETARREAEAAVALDPRDPEARAALVRALVISNRLTPALEEAQRGVADAPESAEAHLALCLVERLSGDVEGALPACRRASEIAPDEPQVLIGLAAVLRERGDYQAAMELLGQAADLDHESVLPQLDGAATLQKQGSLRSASRLYTVILERFPFARTRALQGAAALRLTAGEYEGALELYESIDLPQNASLPTLLSLYGRGYSLFRLERAAEAEYFLSLLIERVPLNYDGPARGREVLYLAYDDLVRYFDQRGRGEKAAELLREAAARPLAPTRLARALVLRQRGGRDGAAAPGRLEQALLRSDPREDPLELAETALLLSRLSSSDGRKAVRPGSSAGQAIRLAAARVADSPLGVVHYRMARAFALSRDIDSSLRSLEKARAGGFLPPDQAASEKDFSILRGRTEFQALLNP
jgi:tetratricopeptide (TPR) repeat protein